MVASAGPMYDLIPKSSADKRYAVYMQPIYSTSTRDPFNGAPGYRASTTGLEVGADTYISDNLLLGVFAGYASADVNFNGVVFAENDSEKQKLFTVGGYGGYRADNWLFSDTLNFIYSKNNSKRNAGLGETAKGDYDTQLLSNQFLASYILPLRDSWKLATELGLNTRYLNRGAFSETDATNALRYSKFQEFFAESVMGLRLRKSFEYDEVRLTPYARVAWSHALLGNDISVRQTLGASTALVTQRNDNDFLNLGLGVSVRKGDTMLSLIYNGEASEHSRSHGLTANLRYEF
jgi:outer membrane autotransporter protein